MGVASAPPSPFTPKGYLLFDESEDKGAGELWKSRNRAAIPLHFSGAITIFVRPSHTMVKMFHHALRQAR